jgi:hypothetical protein
VYNYSKNEKNKSKTQKQQQQKKERRKKNKIVYEIYIMSPPTRPKTVNFNIIF